MEPSGGRKFCSLCQAAAPGNGRAMINISLGYVYQFATYLEPLGKLPKQGKIVDITYDLFQAEAALVTFTQNSIFAPYLRTSWKLGNELLTEIRRLIPQDSPPDFEREFQSYEVFSVTQTYGQYKVALLAEIGSFQSYFVTQKRGYDTFTLLQWGENVFPADLSRKVPDAIFDAREACRCLAFERPTAAGFHIFRATEVVIRKYYAQVTGGKAPPKIRSLGVYLKAMKNDADPKVWTALDQLTKLHRNPVVHPEHVLTMDEASDIFGLAQSAISAMLATLPVQPPTTSTTTGGASP